MLRLQCVIMISECPVKKKKKNTEKGIVRSQLSPFSISLCPTHFLSYCLSFF